jgi:UTP--glucose-1-phosphate uridylyltransferase
LEARLEQSGKTEMLKTIKEISNMAEFIYVRQKKMRGNGDAILQAKNIVGNEPFVVMWGDEFIDNNPVKQAIKLYNKYQGSIFAGFKTNRVEDADRYGFAKGKEVEDEVIKVDELVEKPGFDNLPSNLAIVSTFIFPPEIFKALEKKGETIGEGEELVWLDGVNGIKGDLPAYAFNAGGRYYDCGNKLEYLKTNVEFALKSDEFKDEFKNYLKNITKNL